MGLFSKKKKAVMGLVFRFTPNTRQRNCSEPL